MNNVLDFNTVLMKKNRMSKKVQKKVKPSLEKVWTGYFEYRRTLRKVSRQMIEACLKKGRREEKNGAYHYVLGNLHVVVDRHEETLITVYFKSDFTEEVAAA